MCRLPIPEPDSLLRPFPCFTVQPMLVHRVPRGGLRDQSDGLREFYWVSVFFVPATPLRQFVLLGMGHRSFRIVAGIGGTMMPYLLALLVNFRLSWASGLMFHLLWKWRYRHGTTVGYHSQGRDRNRRRSAGDYRLLGY